MQTKNFIRIAWHLNFALALNCTAACFNSKSSQVKYNPESERWKKGKPEINAEVQSFQLEHPNYSRFALAFSVARSQKTAEGYTFTYTLKSPKLQSVASASITDTLTLAFAPQKLTITFNFTDTALTAEWSTLVDELAAPLARVEPAKDIMAQWAKILADSKDGKPQIDAPYEEPSALWVFLWPLIEREIASTPE